MDEGKLEGGMEGEKLDGWMDEGREGGGREGGRVVWLEGRVEAELKMYDLCHNSVHV